MEEREIVIVGAGPTGLSAGHRLLERGHDDWVVLEATDRVGGLARSETDAAGFTYDIGGHVLFSSYDYHRRLTAELMGGEYREIEREAWIWMRGRYLPYPFQNNLRRLDPDTVYECVSGLVAAAADGSGTPANFAEWIQATFGAGIARHFLVPYNRKVWATPPEEMSSGWIAERVATVDVDRVLRNVILGEDDTSWGPNATFRYPLRGGTGVLYRRLARRLGDRVRLRCPVVAVDPAERVVTTADGQRWRYGRLLSTMPLDDLVTRTESAPDAVRRAARSLVSSSTHVVGVGVDRPAGTTRNWIYYPEADVPFHRVTYLSNYSPHLTPREDQMLLLTETSTSACCPRDGRRVVAEVIDGLVRVGVLDDADRGRIVTTWHHQPAKTYPVPTVGRDDALASIEPWLAERGVANRGRFGAWRYEVGNMDHSCMQGVEWVDAVLDGSPETVWHLPDHRRAEVATS